MFYHLLGNPTYWAVITLCVTAVVMRDLTWKFFHRWWQPKLHHIILEAEVKGDNIPVLSLDQWAAASARGGDEEGNIGGNIDGGSTGIRGSFRRGLRGSGSGRARRGGGSRGRGSTPLVPPPGGTFGDDIEDQASAAVGDAGGARIVGIGRTSWGDSREPSRGRAAVRQGSGQLGAGSADKPGSFALAAPAFSGGIQAGEGGTGAYNGGRRRTRSHSLPQQSQLDERWSQEPPKLRLESLEIVGDGEQAAGRGNGGVGKRASAASSSERDAREMNPRDTEAGYLRPSSYATSGDGDELPLPLGSASSMSRSWSWVSKFRNM